MRRQRIVWQFAILILLNTLTTASVTGIFLFGNALVDRNVASMQHGAAVLHRAARAEAGLFDMRIGLSSLVGQEDESGRATMETAIAEIARMPTEIDLTAATDAPGPSSAGPPVQTSETDASPCPWPSAWKPSVNLSGSWSLLSMHAA